LIYEMKHRVVETNGLDRHSSARWQIIWRSLLPPGGENEVVLDAGAGEHEWSCSDYGVTRCDSWQQYHDRLGETPPEGTDDVDLGLDPWPYPDDTFSGVISVDVIEHLENPWVFWRQAFRVAQRFVIVSTPNVHAPVSHELFRRQGRLWGFTEHEVRESKHLTPVFRWQMEEAALRAGWELRALRYANRPPLPQGGALPAYVLTPAVLGKPNQRAVVALFRPRREEPC
jgi:hypothetical protein